MTKRPPTRRPPRPRANGPFHARGDRRPPSFPDDQPPRRTAAPPRADAPASTREDRSPRSRTERPPRRVGKERPPPPASSREDGRGDAPRAGQARARRPRPSFENRAHGTGALEAGGERAAPGVLWLHGRHPVLAAIANPARRIERLLAVPSLAAEVQAARGTAPAPRPQVEIVERGQLERLIGAGGGEAVHQGIAALVQPLAEASLPDLLKRLHANAPALLCVLDQVSDPRNVGAILRSAAAFGVAGVLVQERHAPPITPALAKAASGALECVPLIRVVNIARALDALRRADFLCLGLAADAPASLAESLAALARPARLALVLGAEDKGLRRLVREHCDALARISIVTAPSGVPIFGGPPALDSLNVSVAAALAFYEATRP